MFDRIQLHFARTQVRAGTSLLEGKCNQFPRLPIDVSLFIAIFVVVVVVVIRVVDVIIAVKRKQPKHLRCSYKKKQSTKELNSCRR